MKSPLPTRPTFPSKADKASKSGSNVRGSALELYQAERRRKILTTLEKHAAKCRREFKAHFSRDELRAGAEIVQRGRAERFASDLKAGADGWKWDRQRATHRRRLSRELAAALPGYTRWRKRSQELRLEYNKLLSATLHPSLPGLADIVVTDLLDADPNAYQYTAPFGLHDVFLSEVGNYPEIRDDSFAVPNIGHVVNNLRLSYDDSTWWFLNGAFGLYRPVYGWSRAGCGVNFTLPQAGKLRVTADLQCLHSRVSLSLEDNWGFSDGDVAADINLYVDIVRGSSVIHLSKTLLSKNLSSDGDDVSTTLPQVDDSVLHTIDVTTDESFQAGDAVQIIAGSELFSSCRLDDMIATVNALLWYQVKKISVSVV